MNPLSEPNVSKLLDTLFYSTDINTLIECAANILKNPISIYNTAFFCVGLSNKKGIDDDLWQQGAIGENIKYEYASNLHDLEQKYRENTVKYKYFYENLDGFGSHRRRVILMIFNSVVIGYMNVLQYHVDFEEIPEELYEIVVGALTKALSVSRTFAYYGGSHNKDKESLEGLLYDLLSEDYASEYFYFQRVNGTVFEKEGNYRILAVNIENAKLISAAIGDLKLSLLATFPRSWSVIIEKHVVVLVDCGKTDSISEKSLSNLDMILNELKIYVGISDSFHSLYYAKKYLYQAEATADMVYVGIRVTINPKLAPKNKYHATRKELIQAIPGMFPFIFLIIVILGGIYSGITTPTEAAAVSVIVALILSAITGGLTWQSVKESLLETIKSYCMIAFIVIGAKFFTYIITMSGVSRGITSWFTSLDASPLAFFLFIIAIYLVLGCLMDGTSIIYLTIPVVYPLIQLAGFDPIWFGVVLTALVEVAMLTPPVGMNLFVLHGITKGTCEFKDIIKGCFPYILLYALLIVLLWCFPSIATWLPHSM